MNNIFKVKKMESFVSSIVENNIAKITFGTPKSNALPAEILEKLAKTILNEGVKPEVKAILLSSYGEKAFCAGASFDELLQISDLETSKNFFGGFAKVLSAMKNCGKIVVVRVQGKVTGGGVGIVCAADYCFGTQQSALALTEINLGIGPFVIGSFVERKIGKSQFVAMSIDAEFRSAEWAVTHNIYHKISNSIEAMDTEIEAFLSKLSTQSNEALTLIKKIAWEGTEYIDNLLTERIEMSSTLALREDTKQRILKIREQLKGK